MLDELLDPRLYKIATNWVEFRENLKRSLADHVGDTERNGHPTRDAPRPNLPALAQDIAGMQTIESLSDHLTELADTIVQETLPLCWSKLKTAICGDTQICRHWLGKMGGKELGYASDLDMVYSTMTKIDAGENYNRLGQRLNSWLSSQTSAGTLLKPIYACARMRLGLLAVSVDSFRNYQLNQQAWVWEHQAPNPWSLLCWRPCCRRAF